LFCQADNITIDVLINNAGIFDFKELSNTTPQRIDTYINLHVRTLSQLCLIFGRDMKQRSNGYILNLSSVSCWMHLPGLSMHSATKSFIRAFSRSLHLELKESGVGVTVACPGAIASSHLNLSEKWQRFWVKIGVLDTPEKFVNGALKKMFANKKQYINGFFNRLSILFVSLLPDRIRLIVKHKILDK
jgi:short-subunit dehydrogenase